MGVENRPMPSYAALLEMSPLDIGELLLPHILARTQSSPSGFVPKDMARVIAERDFLQEFRDQHVSRPPHGITDLLMEGFAALQRAGFLIDTQQSEFVKLSRAGTRAAETGNSRVTAIGSEEAARLLHPTIANEALRELERGSTEGYDSAIFKAFRAVEIALRNSYSATRSGIDAVNDAFNPGKPLVDPTLDAGEQRAIRDLFAGAYGAFRNGPAHRDIGEDDPAQTMRLLLFASSLLILLERIREKVAKAKSETRDITS
jgi:hypothetical protein